VLDHLSGMWIAVPSIADAFVINVGDMLAQWTNDRWRSTLHRVVNPPCNAGARRQSMAFFHNANFHCEVACLPTCTSPENPPRYAPVLAGPHLVAKFRRTG
jgi:isopenicillin N synthase-like dioxygenase